MRRLLVVILVLAIAWGGYWFLGALALERAMVAWLEDRRGEGWVAETSSVSTRGFPNRFDTTLEGLELADPDTGLAWSAPFFQVLALSYKPYHVIAVWPENQRLASPLESLDVTTTEMRGSVVFKPSSRLELDRAQFVIGDMGVTSSDGWLASLREGRLATRQNASRDGAHDIGFEALDVTPAGEWLQFLSGGNDLPEVIQLLKIDATVAFDAPWDRFAIETARPQPTYIDLKLARAEWGALALQLTGEVDVDDQGFPVGNIEVQARNWRDMLALAVSAGAIPAETQGSIETALGLLAGLSGNPETLDTTLTFRNGLVAFGPIPIGPAPRLVLR